MVRERGPRAVRRRDLLVAVGGTGASVALADCSDEEGNSDGEGSDGDDPDPGLPGVGSGCDRGRTDDTALPFDADGYGGWGGHAHHGTASGRLGRPVVFVHGNGRDACDFDEHAAYFIERGYSGDALWSITFEYETSTHGEMADQLDALVGRVSEYTGAERVDLVGHSLGVTGIRYWLADRDRYEHVESLVGLRVRTTAPGPVGRAVRPGPARPGSAISFRMPVRTRRASRCTNSTIPTRHPVPSNIIRSVGPTTISSGRDPRAPNSTARRTPSWRVRTTTTSGRVR